MANSQTKKNRPEKKISPVNSGVSVVIWLNKVETDKGTRHFRSVTIEPRRYYDRKDGEWKDSSSFGPADLPLLLYALEQARDFVFSEPLPGEEKSSDHDPEGDEHIPY